MKQNLLSFITVFFLSLGVSFSQANVASASSGGSVSISHASSTDLYWVNGGLSYLPSGIIDGDKVTPSQRWIWNTNGGAGNINGSLPVTVTIMFDAVYSVDAYSIYGASEPIVSFDVEAEVNGVWLSVASVTGNSSVELLNQSFSAVSATGIRYIINSIPNDYLRIYEIEVFEAPPGFDGDEEVITTLDGVLDNASNTISDLSLGELASELLSGLGLSSGVTSEILTSFDIAVADTEFITTGMKLKTTSGFDGSTREYDLSTVNLTNLALNKTVSYVLTSDAVLHAASFSDASILTTGALLSLDGSNPVDRFLVDLNASGATVEIEIDLGGSFDIGKYALYTAGSTSQVFQQSVTDFVFEYWNGVEYVNIETVTGNTDASYYKSFTPVTTDKVRLITTAGDDGFARFTEIQVLGGASGSLNVVNNINDVSKFSVYPNPSNGDYININSSEVIKIVDFYNVVGEKIMTVYKNNKVNISNLKEGIYFVRINNGEAFSFLRN